MVTEMEHHANIIPWQMLAAEKGIDAAVGAHRRRGPASTPERPRHGCSTVPSCWACFTAMSNVLGHDQPRGESSSTRRTPPVRSRWSTPASSCRTYPTDVQAMDADFVVVHRPQVAGPHGHRRAVGSGRIARRHAPVPRRRRDDPPGHQGPASPPTSCRGSSKPAHPWWARPSASARPSTTSKLHRDGDHPRARRPDSPRYALRALTDRYGDEITIHGPSEPAGRGGVISPSSTGMVHPPRHRPGARPAQHLRARRTITAPSP